MAKAGNVMKCGDQHSKPTLPPKSMGNLSLLRNKWKCIEFQNWRSHTRL